MYCLVEEITNGFEQLLDATQGGVEHGKAFDNLMNCLHPPHLTRLLAWPFWYSAHIDLTQVCLELYYHVYNSLLLHTYSTNLHLSIILINNNLKLCV